MACFVTPPYGVQVTGVGIEPVIINVIPAIKVYLDSVLLQCRYSGSTDKGGIPFVYSFQSLGRLKTRLGALEREKGKWTNIKLNMIQKVERTNYRMARTDSILLKGQWNRFTDALLLFLSLLLKKTFGQGLPLLVFAQNQNTSFGEKKSSYSPPRDVPFTSFIWKSGNQ